MDKKAISNIIDTDFGPREVDLTDDNEIKAVCKVIICMMQKGNEYWEQLTPET